MSDRDQTGDRNPWHLSWQVSLWCVHRHARQNSLIEETLKEMGEDTWRKLVSKVYGEALFEVAVDHGNAIRLMNETAELQKILEDNPDFDKLMKHPGIPKQEKLSMVEKVFRAG